MRQKNEKGNALFLILIAVVLFAALSYAITQSNRGGGGAAKETTSLAASSILDYMSDIKMGFMRLQLRGLQGYGGWYEDGIHMTGPRNGAFDTNEDLIKGNIFHPNGGGAAYRDADIGWVNEVDKTTSTGNLNQFAKRVNGVGGNSQETIIVLSDVREAVCKKLNFILFNNEDIPTIPRTEEAFNIGGNAVDDVGDVTNGHHAYCIKTNDSDTLYFYYVVGEDAGGDSPW